MKRVVAVAMCGLLSGVALQRAKAQRVAPRAHSISSHGNGGYLGVGVAEIDEDRAKSLHLKDDYGVEVKSVEEDSAAAKAGLKEGDILLEYNGQRIEGVDQFIRLVRETPAHRKVTLVISRNGSQQTLSATMGAREGQNWNGFEFSLPEAPLPPDPAVRPEMSIRPNLHLQLPEIPRTLLLWQNGTVGIEVESLNAQLAEYFGVKSGVLVRSVVKNSSADKSGVHAGDVIIRVNGVAVSSPREVSSQLRAGRTKRTVPFVVMRNHKETSFDLKLNDDWGREEPSEDL